MILLTSLSHVGSLICLSSGIGYTVPPYSNDFSASFLVYKQSSCNRGIIAE